MSDNKVLFKGTIILEINETGTKADLTFRPDEKGGSWTRGGLIQLFEEKNIKDSLDPGALEDAIKRFAELKEGELKFTIARGIEPGRSEPGKIRWESLTVPDDKRAEAEMMLKEAPSPEVYEIREKMIKIEKVEKKKSLLPFMKAKEEKTVLWQKKDERKRIDVEEKVEAYGFVGEDQLLAVVEAGKPGTAGRTLSGKTIKPPEARDITVFAGNGVKISGKEIKAEMAGLARRGSNWIDIIAYLPHRIEIKSSKDNTDCLMDFIPGFTDNSVPDIAGILADCEKIGFKCEVLKSEDEIKQIINDSINNGIQLKNYSLNKSEESQIIISVSPDKCKAELTLKKGTGQGKRLTLKEISEKINGYKFKGMDGEKIKKDILDFYNSNNQELKKYVLVEGTEPGEGEDGEIKCEFNFISEEETAKLKKQAEAGTAELAEIKSLDKFPISSVEKIGFVEKGTKVASIVPPANGRPGKDVFGKTIPGKKGKKAKYRIFENLLISATQVTSKINGIIESGEVKGELQLRARPYKNGNATVTISGDAMKAFLTIVSPLGSGTPIDYDTVKKIIDEEGIKKGIDDEAVKNAVEISSRGEPVENLLIAQGKRPINDMGKKPVFHVQFASGKRVTIRKNGRADYKNKDLITTIVKGQLLAEVDVSDVTAEDGWDIMGNTVPAVKHSEIVLEAGKNVRKETDKGGTLKFFAEKDGELQYERNIIEILEVHTVAGDVGIATGNINFSGTVIVKGSVLDGYQVIAGGDIVVEENVQAALLSAEGSIIIKNGVKGAGRAILRTKKNIETAFIEQATVLAVGDVKVSGSCLRCKIKCNNKVILESDKGNFVGGEVRAKSGIEVMNLGSESWVKTAVSFGQDYLVGDRLQLEEKEIDKLKQYVVELDALMKKIEKSGGTDNETMEKLRRGKVHALKVMEKRSHRVFTLKERFEEHIPSEVKVRGTVYPGAVLESHGRFYEFKEPKKGIAMLFNEKLGLIEEEKE
ncbi:MAG: DUF342 domain-containing protein [Spirochaetes bacterium]|nr:DUF342 domain-containing protein [Spirochaetota bacterium]